MNRGRAIENREAGLIGLVLLVLLAAGSLWDYPLSSVLYHPASWFGQVLAAYGEYPASLGFVAAGTLLVLGRNRQRRAVGILQAAGGILLALMGGLMACAAPMLYLSWPKPVLVLIGLASSAATVGIMVRLSRTARRETILRVAAVLALSILAEVVLINLMKNPWGRPRMRLLAEDARAVFAPWWQPGTAQRDTLVSAGVAAEEFKSFPSGHSGNAAALVLLTLLPRLDQRLASKRRLLLAIGCGWAYLVAFSRIIMGAHFLSDTAVGMACGFACCLLVSRLVFRREPSAKQM